MHFRLLAVHNKHSKVVKKTPAPTVKKPSVGNPNRSQSSPGRNDKMEGNPPAQVASPNPNVSRNPVSGKKYSNKDVAVPPANNPVIPP